MIKQNQSEVGQIQLSFFQLTVCTIFTAVLQKTPLKLVSWFQRYEQLKDAKNNRKQKTFSPLFGSILKSIFPTSDWFCLITSHVCEKIVAIWTCSSPFSIHAVMNGNHSSVAPLLNHSQQRECRPITDLMRISHNTSGFSTQLLVFCMRVNFTHTWILNIGRQPKCVMGYANRGGFRGGAPGGRPQFLAEIGRLTLCGCPRQKECTESCELTLKITIFIHFWGGTTGTSPSDTPTHTGAEALSILNLGAPSFKKSWIRPWPKWSFDRGEILYSLFL